MNYFSGSEVIAPKPLFRYQTADSCLLIYSEDGPKNMISSAGCTGAPIGLINLNNEVPADFRLMQNYPNPFNPTTTIRFAAPERAEVRLVVTDVLGREVAMLVNGTVEPGVHSAVFDAATLESGQYIATITMSGAESGATFTKTIKLALVK